MILGPVSLLDCAAFVVFLIPQLLRQIGSWTVLSVALTTLPFLLIHMPWQLFRDRYRRRKSPEDCPPFVLKATLFQDIVIRCVRYAFANIPASVGAVFFSRQVALPFATFRMLRHGYLTGCPVHWEEVDVSAGQQTSLVGVKQPVKAVWVIKDPHAKPDVIVYYCHGGGFSMGSAFFYLEFLLAWLTLLVEAETPAGKETKLQVRGRNGQKAPSNGNRSSTKRFRNPAILALEYSLVPHATYPTQVQQTLAGYEYCIREVLDNDASRICVAGDSAGATLILSLLLILTGKASGSGGVKVPSDSTAANGSHSGHRPGFATLISPWCTLVSERNRNTASDYLNAESLHLYARQYVGEPVGDAESRQSVKQHRRGRHSVSDSVASPGDCLSKDIWAQASPVAGFHFLWGGEEVLAPETRSLVARLRHSGCRVRVSEAAGDIHAWPVVSLFLGVGREERLAGLHDIVANMAQAM